MDFTTSSAFSLGGERVSQDVQISAEQAIWADIPIADDAADAESNVAIDVSQLQAIMLLSDVDATVCTNDDSQGSPAQTLTLKANKPFAWLKDSGITNPLTNDITSLFITNDSDPAAAGTLKIRGAQDASP